MTKCVTKFAVLRNPDTPRGPADAIDCRHPDGESRQRALIKRAATVDQLDAIYANASSMSWACSWAWTRALPQAGEPDSKRLARRIECVVSCAS